MGIGLLTTGGFEAVLSRKMAKISAKGWIPLVSKGCALEDDSVGKHGLHLQKATQLLLLQFLHSN